MAGTAFFQLAYMCVGQQVTVKGQSLVGQQLEKDLCLA